MVLLHFTGSEKCDACVKFNREILSTPEFAQYAATNLVLVEVVFPSQKQQVAERMKVNRELKDNYKVSVFPTVILLNSEGKEIGRQLGYKAVGPSGFIAKLEDWRQGKVSGPARHPATTPALSQPPAKQDKAK